MGLTGSALSFVLPRLIPFITCVGSPSSVNGHPFCSCSGPGHMARELEQNHRRRFSESVHPTQFYKHAQVVQTVGRHAVMRENKDTLLCADVEQTPRYLVQFKRQGKRPCECGCFGARKIVCDVHGRFGLLPAVHTATADMGACRELPGWLKVKGGRLFSR